MNIKFQQQAANNMGFFSAVKRFFGQKSASSDKEAVKEATQPQEISEKIPENDENAAFSVEKTAAPVSKEAVPESAGEAEKQEAQAGQISAPGISAAQAGAEQEDERAKEEPPADVKAEPEIAQTSKEAVGEAARKDDAAAVNAPQNAADQEMLARLRNAPPQLSAWLDIVLEGVSQADDLLWQRLRFLLNSLEAPESEIEAFVSDFSAWLQRMEYVYLDEFRSELQYRLALALDLEDEEDERNRLLVKLGQGLAQTRAQLGRRLDALLADHGELSDSFWEELEEVFITADMGYETSLEIVERLKRRALDGKAREAAAIRGLLREELEEIFRQPVKIRAVNKPEVILMMGVNGAGKTTTIAKLAYRDRLGGKKVLVAAADTFRAAAIEQLEVWAKRAGVEFFAKPAGSDPASVAWEAMDYALKNDIDVVYIDTAGRLQTRVNLMEELGKIRQVVGKKHNGAPHRSMLVLDATTGQNALSQSRLFREAAGADEIVLTKLDGTAKGGVAIAVAMQDGLPITYIGLGEKMEDLRPFNGNDFARALLADTEEKMEMAAR